MAHLFDLPEERLDGLEEGSEIRAPSKALLVAFDGVPLDPQDPVLRLLDALGELVAQAVIGGVERLSGFLIGALELVGLICGDGIADVLDDQGFLAFLIQSGNVSQREDICK